MERSVDTRVQETLMTSATKHLEIEETTEQSP